ncbi:hypothetical protein NA78x_004377 [Anatilimnocola sp. NA78]|uniref:hypothetical protein n=1 Tax=Anatilimnocola sp. NA78 TaxID=3415683 RepID=UPI003CE5C77F
MHWVPSPSVRSMVLVAFLIGLPVLAIPYVSKNFDVAIYGAAKKSVPDLIVSTTPQRTPEPVQIDGVSPARFDESLIQQEPERNRPQSEGLDAVVTAPPLFNAPPTFAGRLPAKSPESGGQPYVQQVRQRLEELGAQYVVLEELDPGRQYRFSVQMQVAPRQPNTRPFEAVASDPDAAARMVLTEVETWRVAAIPSPALQR